MTLYAIDKKNKIRVFKVEVSAVSPSISKIAYVTTYTGLLDGNLIERDKTITSGKQNRSVEAQAQFEAESLTKEKVDEGYKSLDSLEARYQELYGFPPSSSSNLLDHIFFLFRELDIRHNTNSYWLPLPMLAEKYKDKKASIKFPCLVQPKLNGVRCIAVWNEKLGKVSLLSRGGQIYNVPHIEIELHKYISNNRDIQLDGELYKHGLSLQEIVGKVKVEDPTQYTRKLDLEYHVYDLAVDKLSQEDRISIIQTQVVTIGKPIIVVPTLSCYSHEQAKQLHDIYVGKGYEGLMIRDSKATYQFGFRDSCLIKMKEFIDEEFEILGCEVDPNKGIESFVFVLKNNIKADSASTFKARPTGTLEEKDIWRNNIAKFIGKKATVRYQERTLDGLPHQGNLRAEKTPILVEAIRDYE